MRGFACIFILDDCTITHALWPRRHLHSGIDLEMAFGFLGLHGVKRSIGMNRLLYGCTILPIGSL